MTDDKIAYAIKVMTRPASSAAVMPRTLGIGAITAEHWAASTRTWSIAARCPAGWDVDKLITTQFVNKKVAIV